MRHRHILIDGYSMLHRLPHLKALLDRNLQAARIQLVREVEPAAGHLAPRVTVVFDGQSAGADPALERPGLAVRFTPADATADLLIERLVYEDPAPHELLVVTSDLAERRSVIAAGAESLSCGDFAEQCRRLAREFRHRTATPPARPFRPTVGEALDGGAEARPQGISGLRTDPQARGAARQEPRPPLRRQ